MTPPNNASHLSDASAHGKKYAYKKDCIWCYAPYDADLSDSLKPHVYCSLECQTQDEYLEERAKFSE